MDVVNRWVEYATVVAPNCYFAFEWRVGKGGVAENWLMSV